MIHNSKVMRPKRNNIIKTLFNYREYILYNLLEYGYGIGFVDIIH